ncbi:HAD family hydrolase [Gephyromycinifex aptenodytis]|uniref:HAD family hydrolase n=1 Tax=Gephyromycinifex aptenodytis TaxID=2716227 RepID=UPI0014481646|nr:HAD family phosphatase [Gephyromycinifex aptenodytis]
MSRTALLVDYGGVLTESLHDAFATFAAQIGLPADLPLRLLSTDEAARAAFVAHECGRASDEEFEAAYADALGRHGADVDAHGLIARVLGGLGLDHEMLDLVARVRASGVPVALVTNSLGRDAYRGVDLNAIADTVVISGVEGVRKPSRAIYQLACERLGVAPTDCVMVDDLRANLDGAARLGIVGVLHRDAASTAAELAVHFDNPGLVRPDAQSAG